MSGDQRRQRRRDLTQGPILSALLALALPIVGANLLQTVYQLTDTFWVGRLGAEAVAAVSLGFPVLFVMISLGGGLAVAGAILVAQYQGAGDPAMVNRVAGQTLIAVVVVSTALSVVGYMASAPLMRLFGAAPNVLPDAARYLEVSFLGLVFVFIYFVFQSLMRGVGDVRTPFYIVLGTVALNFVADPLFILGWGPFPAMGVVGAAVATVLTQGLAGAVGLVVLLSGRYGISLRPTHLTPDFALIGRIVSLGFPASVEQSMRALGLAVMMILVSGFGTTVVASYGIGTRILSFVIIPALGLQMATTTIVGQNVGAGHWDRVKRSAAVSAWLGFGAMTAIGILFFFIARPLTAAFVPDDPAVIEAGSRFLRIMALSFGFIGVQQVLAGAFRGTGNTMAAMGLAIVSLWVLRFPIAYVLSARTDLGADGLWWSFPVSNVVAAAIALAWVLRGRWPGRGAPEETRLEEEVSRETMVDEGLGGG